MPATGILSKHKQLKGVVEDVFGPITGASVVVKGTTNGIVTDMDGNFVLNDLKQGDIVVAPSSGI